MNIYWILLTEFIKVGDKKVYLVIKSPNNSFSAIIIFYSTLFFFTILKILNLVSLFLKTIQQSSSYQIYHINAKDIITVTYGVKRK